MVQFLQLEALARAVPLDNLVRIEVLDGIPVFRAPPSIQERIEDLLEKQQSSRLTDAERSELARYEELDDFLSLVNRLVRSSMHPADDGSAHAPAA